MSLLQLAIIATLQGITEWLPISSSAHVLLASDTFGVTGRDELLINAVSNLGTLAAMLIYFRKDVMAAIIGGFELLASPVTKKPLSQGARLAACVIVATPIALIADPIDGARFAPGALVVLQGSALDLEDGRLADEALHWSSDRQGNLGTGPSIPLTALEANDARY